MSSIRISLEKLFSPKNATLLYFSIDFDNDFFDPGPGIRYNLPKPIREPLFRQKPLKTPLEAFRVHHQKNTRFPVDAPALLPSRFLSGLFLLWRGKKVFAGKMLTTLGLVGLTVMSYNPVSRALNAPLNCKYEAYEPKQC
jgi:hypothetical protein